MRVGVLGATMTDATSYAADALIHRSDVTVRPLSCHAPEQARGLSLDLVIVTPAARNHHRIAYVLGLLLPTVAAGRAH